MRIVRARVSAAAPSFDIKNRPEERPMDEHGFNRVDASPTRSRGRFLELVGFGLLAVAGGAGGGLPAPRRLSDAPRRTAAPPRDDRDDDDEDDGGEPRRELAL